METVVLVLILLAAFAAGLTAGCVLTFVWTETEPAKGILRVVTLEPGEPPNLFLELEQDFDFSGGQGNVKFDVSVENYISQK